MLNLIPLPYRILGFLALVAALWAHGWFQGRSGKQAELDAYKADIAAQVAIQKARNEETLKRHQKAAKDAQNDLKTRLSYVNDAYARLRDSRSGVPSLAQSAPRACPEPGSADKPDAIARYLESIEAEVERVIQQGDSELAKYKTLWELTNK